jgi:hypothetical protein
MGLGLFRGLWDLNPYFREMCLLILSFINLFSFLILRDILGLLLDVYDIRVKYTNFSFSCPFLYVPWTRVRQWLILATSFNSLICRFNRDIHRLAALRAAIRWACSSSNSLTINPINALFTSSLILSL